MTYKTLEDLSFLGTDAPKYDGAAASFFASSTFLYTLCFIIIVGAAFYQYMMVGIYRLEASESGIRKSNETFRRATLGLLGVFGLFLLLAAVNKDLLLGDVGLSALKVRGGGVSTVPMAGKATPTSSISCISKEQTITNLSSSNGICGQVACRSLSGCLYQRYLPVIKEEAARAGIDYKIVVAIMCRESSGHENPPQRTGVSANSNGMDDCGLMQINRPAGQCASILPPRENIREGIQKLKQKMNTSTARIYPGVLPITNAFADYNCCGGGDVASSPSADCGPISGFPGEIPKWACPINPGSGPYNMCGVRDYACEVASCINAVP